jgi:hypothetical protein
MRVKHENCSTQKSVAAETVAQAFLELLADRRIDYLFGNGGTDFAPVLDALAWAKEQGGADWPQSPFPMKWWLQALPTATILRPASHKSL